MRRHLVPVLVFSSLLVGLNVALGGLATRSQRGRLLEKLESTGADATVLFLGNSLLNAAYDGDQFRASAPGVVAVDATLGQTTSIEHAILLREAVQVERKLKWVVYGYFDDQLNQDPPLTAASLSGNRALAYSFPELSSELAEQPSISTRLRLQVFGALPMLRERSSVWQKVEKLRRVLSEIGMPHQETNQFGRAEDFAALDTPVSDFIPRANTILARDAGLAKPVRDILAVGVSHGAQVLVVEMPMPTAHRQGLYATDEWKRLRARNVAWVEAAGGRYLSASDWVPDRGFSDPVHMNGEGAQVFSRKIAEVLLVAMR